jgi:plastocyanin
MRWSGLPGAAVAVCAAAAATALAGCGGVTDQGNDVVNGKQLFVSKCGACHVLSRAGTKGVTGPNLDEAFARAREDGFGSTTFEGIVHRQIEQPNKNPQVDPATGKTLPMMPANLVSGSDAKDVAAYVADAVAKGGKDAGRLASIGAASAKGTAKESNGKLAIPADPGGALAYQFANATAKAGQLTIDSQNKSSTPHDIAIEGNGVSETGKVVQDGGTSTVSADLKPGKYQFFCTVPGHRQAGMEGTLVVK